VIDRRSGGATQIHGTYIVARPRWPRHRRQHAAHERIVYERLSLAGEERLQRKILLIRKIVRNWNGDRGAAVARRRRMASFGLAIESFVPAQSQCARRPPCSARPMRWAAAAIPPEHMDEWTKRCRWNAADACRRHHACHGSVRSRPPPQAGEMTAAGEMEDTPNSGPCNTRSDYVE